MKEGLKLFFINRPSLKETTVPQFYYTFAKDEEAALLKVSLRWGEYDPKATARELTDKELSDLVVATDNY